MNKYVKSILILGYLPSAVVLIALVVGAIHFRGNLEEKKRSKKADYESVQEGLKKVAILDSYLSKDQRREKMKFLDSHLDDDLLQVLSKNLAEVLSEYDEKDIHNTEIGQPTSGSSIASQTENSFSRVNLAFEGHYSAIQRTVAELEFRMPQLSLESLSISPNLNAPGPDELPRLKVKLNYLCWHHPKTS